MLKIGQLICSIKCDAIVEILPLILKWRLKVRRAMQKNDNV